MARIDDRGFWILAETDGFGSGERDGYVLKLDCSGKLVSDREPPAIPRPRGQRSVADDRRRLPAGREDDGEGESFEAVVTRIDAQGRTGDDGVSSLDEPS